MDSFYNRSLKIRNSLLDIKNKKFLLAKLSTSEYMNNTTPLNGFGRLWYMRDRGDKDWGIIPFPFLPASKKLGIDIHKIGASLTIQISGCNLKCWFCYVDDKLLESQNKDSQFFNASDIIDYTIKYNINILRISGGESELVPEVSLWLMEESIKKDKLIYLWSDSNLVTDFTKEGTQIEILDKLYKYKYYGRVGTIKGLDSKSFSENSGLGIRYYNKQFEILKRWYDDGIDFYIYIHLLYDTKDKKESDISQCIEILLDKIEKIDKKLLYKIYTIKVKEYLPVSKRNSRYKHYIDNQDYIRNIFIKCIEKRIGAYRYG